MIHGNVPRSATVPPEAERTTDFSRGELRLAAEVAVAPYEGDIVPPEAGLRGFAILRELANGE